jgi:hypothetical protein
VWRVCVGVGGCVEGWKGGQAGDLAPLADDRAMDHGSHCTLLPRVCCCHSPFLSVGLIAQSPTLPAG